jgi:hypothetical protein
VGAILKSLGFPVSSGHAHPFQFTAPFIFFSRGTSFIHHAQSRGHFVLAVFIPESRKNGKDKKAGESGSRRKNHLFSASCRFPKLRLFLPGF